MYVWNLLQAAGWKYRTQKLRKNYAQKTPFAHHRTTLSSCFFATIGTRRLASADRTARGQFQATGQPVSRTQAAAPWDEVCATQVFPMRVGPFAFRYQGERSYPLPIYWYHSKGTTTLRYNFAADRFYIMKLCSRLFVLYCRNCP